MIEPLPARYQEQPAEAPGLCARPGAARRAGRRGRTPATAWARFRTGPHLVSRAGRAPLDHQSGSAPDAPGPAKPTGPGRHHRRDRRGGLRHQDPRRRPPPGGRARTRGTATACAATGNTQLKASPAAGRPRPALPGPRPGPLPAPARHPPPGRPPRRQARLPRLRGHPLPHPRTRPRPDRPGPGHLTHTTPHALTSPDDQEPLPHAQLISIFRVMAPLFSFYVAPHSVAPG